MMREVGGYGIIEFGGIRQKIYSFDAIKLLPNSSYERFAKHPGKGIQRVLAAWFSHEQYKKQLETPEHNFVIYRRLGTRLHNI